MADHEDNFPTDRGENWMPRRSAEMEPAELDAIAADVNRDIEAGVGLKHFEDVIDEFYSSQGNAKHDVEAREREERMGQEICRDLKREATMQLLSHGLRVTDVRLGLEGFVATIGDREGRRYEATITFTEAAKIDLALDPHGVFAQMVSTLCERALSARATYYRRAQLVLT